MIIAAQGDNVLADKGNAVAGSVITTKAYLANENAESVFFIAEYEGNELVGVKIDDAYTPSKADNTVKIFVWNSESGIMPVAPMTTLTVVAAEQ